MNPEQQLLSYGWQQLPIRQLVKLCRTNKSFTQLCNQESTWQFLLNRDFNINSTDNSRKKYVKQLLKRAALMESKQADLYMQNIGKLQPPYIIRLYQDNIYIYKFIQSLLGVDTKQQYFDFFGNNIGITARDELVRMRDLAINVTHNRDITIFDILINLANGVPIESE